MDDLDRLRRSLGDVGSKPLAVPIVEHLAELWIGEAKRTVGVDTGQLKNRTAIRSIGGTASRADADLIADTPYAGYHEFGTRYTAPNPFFRRGMELAEREANRIGGRVETQLRRSLTSGGVWNPRALF